MGSLKVCFAYIISFPTTQRPGGHIPQALEAHNKSKTQTTQSLTRYIPSLSSLSHQNYSTRLGLLNIGSAWSRACILSHLPRPLHATSFFATSRSLGVAHFPPRIADSSPAHQLLPSSRGLFSPARGLVRSLSRLSCEHINNTTGLALLHKPSPRFLHPEACHADSVTYSHMPSLGPLLDF